MTGTTNQSDDSERVLLAPVREGETVGGKYVAGRVLGVGGMGIVIAARDKLLEREVAIKFLLPRLASSNVAVQRFIREARAAARITSEHVVKLLEIDELPTGMPYFVMEYLEGADLRAILADTGPIPAVRAVDYVMQALQAIAEGHLRGIVHRDLKPSNLFVTYRADRTPLIKVLDFGIAKSVEPEAADESRLTGSDETWLGSPAYMSPEQLRSPGEVDASTDVWGMGVTLYELLCGSQAYQGKTYADLVLQISSGPPEPPSRRREGLSLPEGLEQVILRCLERDKSRRYANALELATALAPFGSDDARASLRRVKGLSDAPPTSPTPSAPDEDQHGPCTTTLQVPPEANPFAERRRRERRSRRRVAWLVLAGGAGVAATAGAALLLAAREPSSASAPQPASAATAPTQPVEPAPVAKPDAPQALDTEPPAVPEPAPERGQTAAPSRAARAELTPERRRHAPSRPAASAVIPASSTAIDGRIAADAEAPAVGVRSPEIERLIEERH